jgi:hypothetical protein
VAVRIRLSKYGELGSIVKCKVRREALPRWTINLDSKKKKKKKKSMARGPAPRSGKMKDTGEQTYMRMNRLLGGVCVPQLQF